MLRLAAETCEETLAGNKSVDWWWLQVRAEAMGRLEEYADYADRLEFEQVIPVVPGRELLRRAMSPFAYLRS
jgi:hypothetical protein